MNMPSYNKAIVIGHLGRDPELRHTQNGNPVCNINLATTDKYTAKNGEKVEHTEWHRIVAWGRTAEVCAEYLRKGDAAMFEGRLQTREWEKDGEKRYSTEIVADRMIMLGKRDTTQPELPMGEKKEDNQDDDLPF